MQRSSFRIILSNYDRFCNNRTKDNMKLLFPYETKATFAIIWYNCISWSINLGAEFEMLRLAERRIIRSALNFTLTSFFSNNFNTNSVKA